jgi:hypothetical protein
VELARFAGRKDRCDLDGIWYAETHGVTYNPRSSLASAEVQTVGDGGKGCGGEPARRTTISK